MKDERKEHYFRKLTVWQRSLSFATKVYAITTQFPKSEQFGLSDQIRRAVTSIALNIAEGSGAGSNIEFMRFLHIAKRSAYEVITGLEIANNLHYLQEAQAESSIGEAQEICAMIVGLQRKLGS